MNTYLNIYKHIYTYIHKRWLYSISCNAIDLLIGIYLQHRDVAFGRARDIHSTVSISSMGLTFFGFCQPFYINIWKTKKEKKKESSDSFVLCFLVLDLFAQSQSHTLITENVCPNKKWTGLYHCMQTKSQVFYQDFSIT